jgi:invasion protein IalB
MRLKLKFSFFILFAICWLPQNATAEDTADADKFIQLTYSGWVKWCSAGKAPCMIANDAKLPSGQPVLSVVLFQFSENSRGTLRVALPLGMLIGRGTRVIVDGGRPVQAPYVRCLLNGCKSDYKVTPQLIDSMKTGKNIVVQAINSDNKPISLPVPLAGFAEVFDGPPDPTKKPKLDDEGYGDLTPYGSRKTAIEPATVVSPWTKFCLTGKEPGAKEVCFTGNDLRKEDGTPVLAAVVIEPTSPSYS